MHASMHGGINRRHEVGIAASQLCHPRHDGGPFDKMLPGDWQHQGPHNYVASEPNVLFLQVFNSSCRSIDTGHEKQRAGKSTMWERCALGQCLD